jgi:hypothetical protein
MFGKMKKNTYRTDPIHRRWPPIEGRRVGYPLEAATALSRKVPFHHHLFEPFQVGKRQ